MGVVITTALIVLGVGLGLGILIGMLHIIMALATQLSKIMGDK